MKLAPWILAAVIAVGALVGNGVLNAREHHAGYTAGFEAGAASRKAEIDHILETTQDSVDQANTRVLTLKAKALHLQNQLDAAKRSKIATRRCVTQVPAPLAPLIEQ